MSASRGLQRSQRKATTPFPRILARKENLSLLQASNLPIYRKCPIKGTHSRNTQRMPRPNVGNLTGKIFHSLQQITNINCKGRVSGWGIELSGKTLAAHAWASELCSRYQRKKRKKGPLAGHGGGLSFPHLGSDSRRTRSPTPQLQSGFKASLGYIVTWRLA